MSSHTINRPAPISVGKADDQEALLRRWRPSELRDYVVERLLGFSRQFQFGEAIDRRFMSDHRLRDGALTLGSRGFEAAKTLQVVARDRDDLFHVLLPSL